MPWFQSWKGVVRFLTGTMFQSHSSVITRRNRNGPTTNLNRMPSTPSSSALPTAASLILRQTSLSPIGMKPDALRSYPEVKIYSIEIPSAGLISEFRVDCRLTFPHKIRLDLPVSQEFLESIYTSRLISTHLPSMPSPTLVRDDG